MLNKTISVIAIISNVAALAFLGFTAYWLWSLSKEDDKRERIAS